MPKLAESARAASSASSRGIPPHTEARVTPPVRVAATANSEPLISNKDVEHELPALGQLREALAGGRYAILACEPTLEGVLCAVGLSYLAHAAEGQVRLARADACQPSLAEAVIAIPGSECDAAVLLARRVWQGYLRAIEARPREEFPHRLVYAAASDSPDMPELVHRYLRLCFARGAEVRLMTADPAVIALDDLARQVSNECEKTRQFVRFSHLADGSCAASFRPRADTVPLVAQHFCRRMGTERFYLLDPGHRVVALHEAGERRCSLVRLDEATAHDLCDLGELADDERYVRAMWKRLYDALTLEGRGPAERGYDLRLHFMPRRLWEGLTELDPRSDDPGAVTPERYRG